MFSTSVSSVELLWAPLETREADPQHSSKGWAGQVSDIDRLHVVYCSFNTYSEQFGAKESNKITHRLKVKDYIFLHLLK